MSKLCFTGMVVTLIVPMISGTANFGTWLVASLGICLTVLSAMVANKILK